jgi:hypothetical protein
MDSYCGARGRTDQFAAPGDDARRARRLERFIGVCLLANRWMRLAVWLLAVDVASVSPSPRLPVSQILEIAC